MHYPVEVFIGTIRDYDGSRPSAIAKVQVDGELTLTELGLVGDEQAEKKSMAGLSARCATIPANTTQSGCANFQTRPISSMRLRLAKIFPLTV